MINQTRLAALIGITLLLAACGGGGGGGGASTSSAPPALTTPVTSATPTPSPSTPVPALPIDTAPANYTPDPMLLQANAADSNSLYVDEKFNFDLTQKIALSLAVQNADQSAAAFKQVFIYALPAELDSFTDEDLIAAPLLLTAITDEVGRINQNVEWPGDIKKLAVKVDAIGIETQAVIAIDTTSIDYSFK